MFPSSFYTTCYSSPKLLLPLNGQIQKKTDEEQFLSAVLKEKEAENNPNIHLNNVVKTYANLADKQKMPEACYRLALMLEKGKGTEANFEQALFYLKRGAELGSINALLRLGNIYRKGIGGVEKNFNTAVEYFRMAHSFKVPEASFMLGKMYKNDGDQLKSENKIKLAV